MLFRRRVDTKSRRRPSRRHFRSNCADPRRIAMRISAGFPVGCCNKSCTLFRCLRHICALVDIVCSGGRCDDLRTRDTDDRRSSNVCSLRISHLYLPSAALMTTRCRSSGFVALATGSDDSQAQANHAEMQSGCENGFQIRTSGSESCKWNPHSSSVFRCVRTTRTTTIT